MRCKDAADHPDPARGRCFQQKATEVAPPFGGRGEPVEQDLGHLPVVLLEPGSAFSGLEVGDHAVLIGNELVDSRRQIAVVSRQRQAQAGAGVVLVDQHLAADHNCRNQGRGQGQPAEQMRRGGPHQPPFLAGPVARRVLRRMPAYSSTEGSWREPGRSSQVAVIACRRRRARPARVERRLRSSHWRIGRIR